MTRSRSVRPPGSRPGIRSTAGAPEAPQPADDRIAELDTAPSKRFIGRQRMLWIVVALACALVAGRMVYVHVIAADSISAEAAQQRTVTSVLPATRGSIVDSEGRLLAHTDDARALTFLPKSVRKSIADEHEKDPSLPDVDTRLKEIAAGVSSALGGSISTEDLWSKLTSDKDFVYLARSITPEIASGIMDEFPEVGADPQSIRVYPGGSLAANIVGDVNYDGNGAEGLESSMESVLAGTDGTETFDQGADGAVIPGSSRNVHPAIDGKTVRLTIDSDAQWFVQTQVNMAKKASGANNVSAVVLDSHTGQVVAMANDSTFNPSLPADEQGDADRGNRSVTSPFEPGSVNKVVTAAAAIEYGVTNPDEVLQVPGSIRMSGITVNDAWPHGTAPYTTTGIFGKSSNVGTLMLAQRVGERRFADMLGKFGLGATTGVGLPGESPGAVPALSQWSGGSFANLPIGQGLSMTLLQMTSMYQAIANDGVRIPPRIIEGGDAPESVQVVSPKTAHTVRDMFRAVMQDDEGGPQQGTGASGAIAGYQTSGKTGTAQQVDPKCNCYSRSSYNITFAGIMPADDPRYVVGIMMDNPVRSSDGGGGQSAAPLFGTIGKWLLQHERVPYSPQPAPRLRLQS
ncbi:peptidoglycan D,D-transpeptidase FtsI family protein [Gordonia zhenghanii]|uniref:peptidoglycan D,D-transpeptidase FtsI family protein n=1 Tax=Gordonia zhenghanii TaxID=2911516 RepID=UPI00355667C0